MKIDTTQILRDIFGKALPDVNAEKVKNGDDEEVYADLTLGAVIQRAMFAPIAGDDKLLGDAKLRLHGLAAATVTGSVDWPVEDIALVKERIGKAYGAQVVGPAFALLG